jgi:hypothetical protein
VRLGELDAALGTAIAQITLHGEFALQSTDRGNTLAVAREAEPTVAGV